MNFAVDSKALPDFKPDWGQPAAARWSSSLLPGRSLQGFAARILSVRVQLNILTLSSLASTPNAFTRAGRHSRAAGWMQDLSNFAGRVTFSLLDSDRAFR